MRHFMTELSLSTVKLARLLPRDLLTAQSLTLSLELQHAVIENLGGQTMLQSWPELMQLYMLLPTNGDAARDYPSFTLTARSSTQASTHTPTYMFNHFVYQGRATIYTSTFKQFTELILVGDSIIPISMQWSELLRNIFGVQRLYVHGIDRKGPGLDCIVMGLSQLLEE